MPTQKDLRIIAITRPSFFSNEAAMITEILERGKVELVHIRKPDSSKEEIERLIREIPEYYHHQLKIHDHFQLIGRFNLAGVHLNNRNPSIDCKVKSLSRSAHSFDELNDWEEYDYITLSPIYDSISKPGYHSSFPFDALKEELKGKPNIMALGGVTPDKFKELKELGFSGAAMLGHFWNNIDN